MAILVTMLILVLLFTVGLTLWHRLKQWRPAGALLMLLAMAICGMLTLGTGVSHSTTETVSLVDPDSTSSQETGKRAVVVTETRTEVDIQGVIMATGLGVLFIMGLLVWGIMFLAWLLPRVRPHTPEVTG